MLSFNAQKQNHLLATKFTSPVWKILLYLGLRSHSNLFEFQYNKTIQSSIGGVGDMHKHMLEYLLDTKSLKSGE